MMRFVLAEVKMVRCAEFVRRLGVGRRDASSGLPV
jgi:hypothetical protein